MEAQNIKPFEDRIYLSSPTMHGDEMKYVKEAYESNWMSTVGENINETEKLCREFVGMKHAVALTTGTSALHMAVKLAGIKKGERVLVSDTTFAATVNPVVYDGGLPVLVDCERETWNMDPVALEKAFEAFPDARVVIAANLYGTPIKYDEILAICKKHGAILIEDSAESMGATYKGKQTGSFGTYNVLSFNGNKIVTGSSGGVLLTNDADAAEKVRKWSTQSRDDAPWYQHSELGYNYRMSNIIAGVIRAQIPYVSEHIAQKKVIYNRYKEALKDLPVSMNPYIENEMNPNFWLSCMLIHKDHIKDSYQIGTLSDLPLKILNLLEQKNIEARPLWKPMHLQPYYKDCPFITAEGLCSENTDTSVGADIFSRGLCLPSDNKITPEVQDLIIELIKSCF